MSKLRKSSNILNIFVVKRYSYLAPSICYQLQNQTNSLSTKDFIFVIIVDMSTITCYHWFEQVVLTSLWSGCYHFKVILTIILMLPLVFHCLLSCHHTIIIHHHIVHCTIAICFCGTIHHTTNFMYLWHCSLCNCFFFHFL